MSFFLFFNNVKADIINYYMILGVFIARIHILPHNSHTLDFKQKNLNGV